LVFHRTMAFGYNMLCSSAFHYCNKIPEKINF
jgi:hypothetical protein